MQDMILISGEALIDLIPDTVKQNGYDAVLGGSPYNVAIGLARLGSKTAFVSRISEDGNGEALAAGLAGNGVDLAYVLRDKRPTTLAFVMRGTAKTGSRYSFYLDATSFDGPWPFPATWPKDARHLHVGSISAVDPRHGEHVVDALKAARVHATVSYDPNIRPLVTPDRASVAALVERQASLANVVKASEEDLQWLYPGRPVEESLAAWASTGPRFCVATLGERGALAVLDMERINVPAPRIEVADTVGAGDSFMSALLSAMDHDSALGARAGAPNRAAVERWLRFAATASAITCTRKGSDPPTRAEVERALRV
jgi:fructokinase